MEFNKITESSWDEVSGLLTTHISGNLDVADIEVWESSLNQCFSRIPNGSVFKIFINLFGFKAANFKAHKRFRTIIPLTLAQYGWKTGYVDLFEEEAKQLNISVTRGIRCVGAAHCHQDETKISLYQERFGKHNEGFFTDPKMAMSWITELSVVIQ